MSEHIKEILQKVDEDLAHLNHRFDQEQKTRVQQEQTRAAVIESLKQMIHADDFKDEFKELHDDSFYRVVADEVISKIPAGLVVTLDENTGVKLSRITIDGDWKEKYSKTYLQSDVVPSFASMAETIINERTTWRRFLK